MENIFFLIIVIIISVIFSAFFAGAETAITGASQATIHRLEIEGNKRAKMVTKLRADKEMLISALLLGNSVCNVLASSIATSAAMSMFGSEGVVYATLIMSFVIIVFAEVLPKTYAFENADRASLAIAPSLSLLVKILYPITIGVQLLVKLVLSIITKKHHKSFMSAHDELRGAIELHHLGGGVVKMDRDMLGSILDLNEREIGDIMIHRRKMVTLNINLPNSLIIEQLMESTHTRVPFWQDNPENIIGILNIKDLLKAARKHGGDFTQINIRDLITEPWFVHETTLLKEQLHEFKKRRNHFALVVDEYGDLMGLVTLEDILEEIVGQIEDEHDIIAEGIKIIDDNICIVEGALTIRDFNRQLEWNLPEDDATTIAGLIMHETGVIPEEGEEFNLFDINFIILRKINNQIVEVKLEKLLKNE